MVLPVELLNLEEQFFLKEDQKLIEKLKLMKKMKETKKALKAVSGIEDDEVLQKLVDLNIRPEIVASLAIIPLIEVAWSDGEVMEEEKEHILLAVNKFGTGKNNIDTVLIERWLEHKPDESLLKAWNQYIKYICKNMTKSEILHLKTEIMTHATCVAEACGGFLGFGKTSKEEAKMLKKLESAFHI
ncbi:MAG: hypothetical protein ACD_79C01037G0001 [uncultured bacterium]|nr:MAG: hypothetical protein ACD_79C01037G0001 [uncultured bacterium]